MPEDSRKLGTNELIILEGKQVKEEMLLDRGDEPVKADKYEPSAIIPTASVGAPKTNAAHISVSALEELAKSEPNQPKPAEPSTTAPRYFLESRIGNKTYPIPLDPGKKRFSIGRNTECDIFFWDEGVSGLVRESDVRERKDHAELRYNHVEYILVDKGSRNGTYVNGEKLKPGAGRALRDGDEILFGRYKVIFRENLRDKQTEK
jgi:hypothetical protein